MKKFLIAAAFAAVSVGAAWADVVENAAGNTVVVTFANGTEVRYLFDDDNTYAMTAPDGSTVNGTYTVADGQICLTPAGGSAQCTEYVGGKSVGESWTQTATDGSTITVRIDAGR